MSPKCLPEKARRKTIQDNILMHTYEELAKLCHCTKRTIIRDINKWKQDGGFDEFLLREFMHLYSKERLTNPAKALDRVVMLLTKGMQRVEVLAQVDEIRLKWQEHEES